VTDEHTEPLSPSWPREWSQSAAEKRDLAAANARIAELETNQNTVRDRADYFQGQHRKTLDETFEVIRERDAANARAEAAEHKATVAAMHEQLASEDAERVRHELEELQDNTVPALESEAEDLRARIAKAIAILSEPGMWSDFAARARKALTDG
jgi:hypothetical protein